MIVLTLRIDDGDDDDDEDGDGDGDDGDSDDYNDDDKADYGGMWACGGSWESRLDGAASQSSHSHSF